MTSPIRLAARLATLATFTIREGVWSVITWLTEPERDDTMDVAEAMGVTPMDPALVVDWHTHSPALSDASLEKTLAAWSTAAAGQPYVDHAPCEGTDCDRTICRCPFSEVGLPCPGAVEQGCRHHNLLCDDCRPECTECRQDARDDAGVA